MSHTANLFPMQPGKWGKELLLQYCRLHGVPDADAAGSARGSLVEAVGSDLRGYYAACDSAAAALPEAPEGLWAAPSADSPGRLIGCRATPRAAALLRARPALFGAVVDAGVRALSPAALQRLHDEGRQPALEHWLLAAGSGGEGGRLLREAMALEGGGGGTRVCGRSVEPRETLVYCFECAVDRQCVLCVECFQKSPCVNHRHVVKCGSGGGICDCGDPTAWRPESFCSRHRGLVSKDDPTVGMEEETRAWIATLLRGLVQYQIAVMQHFHSVAREGGKVSKAAQWADRFLRRASALTLMVVEDSEVLRRLLCEGLLSESILPPLCAPSIGRYRRMSENSEEEEEEDDDDDDDVEKDDEPGDAEETSVIKDSESSGREPGAVSCVEAIFLLDMALEESSDLHLWHTSILFTLDKCVSDPIFRKPCGALLLKYSEHLVSTLALHVEKLFVQVLTSKEVVDALLCPPHEPVLGGSNVVQRMLSAFLYLSNSITGRSSIHLESYSHFGWRMHTLFSASERARGLLVSSRSLFSDWCTSLCNVARRSVLRRKVRHTDAVNLSFGEDRAMWMDYALVETSVMISNSVFDVSMALCKDAPLAVWLRDIATDSLLPPPKLAPEYYLRDLLTVAARIIGASIAAYRRRYLVETSNHPALGGAISAYDLLDPDMLHPTSYIRMDFHFFARIAALWPRLCDAVPMSASGEWSRPLAAALARVDWCAEHWIDATAMPFVLVGQVEQNLWQNNRRDVLYRTLHYLRDGRPDLDTGLQQLTLAFVAPGDFAAQLLQRYSYVPSRRGRRVGYPSFLRHVLQTSVAECGVAVADRADLKHVVRRRIAHELAKGSQLSFRGVNEAVRGELGYAGTADDVQMALRDALNEIAVSREFAQGKVVFSLRSAAVWRAHVDLYHPLVRDYLLSNMLEEWSRLLRDENTQHARETNDEPRQQPATFAFPLPVLRWLDRKRELELMQRPTAAARIAHMHERACLLLQTPAVLSVAAHMVHEYVRCVIPRHLSTDSGVQRDVEEGNNSLENEEETKRDNHVFKNIRSLAHAVAVLYLAVQGAAELTGVASVDKIDWTALSARMSNIVPPPSIAPDAIEALLPVKGFASANATLREHMQVHVPYLSNSSFPSSSSSPSFSSSSSSSFAGMTTAEALRILAAHVRSEGADAYGVAAMAESVLFAVGARQSGTNDDSGGNVNVVVKEDQRRQRLKEKQAALLRRARGGAAKVIAAFAQKSETSVSEEKTRAFSSSEGSRDVKKSVVARLLSRSAEEVCCVCRNKNSNPLYFFGHMSTSDVLDRLRFAKEDSVLMREGDKELTLNVHYTICGHMAHKECVVKALRYTRDNFTVARIFSGAENLPENEFKCPLCIMVCNVLCHVPQLVRAVESGSTLFETVRRERASLKETDEVPVAVVCATVGLPVSAPSQNRLSLSLISHRELQKRDPHVWKVVASLRAVRSQMRVALEWVKAGGTLRYKELMSILLLLISIKPMTYEVPQVEKAIRGVEGSEEALVKREEGAEALCPLSFIFDFVQKTKEVASLMWEQTRRIAFLAAKCDALIEKKADKDEEGNARANGLVMVLWRELGCLTILKLFLDDRTVEPDASASASRCDVDDENHVPRLVHESNGETIIATLEPAALETAASRRHAVLWMFCYLLDRQPPTANNSDLASFLGAFRSSDVRPLIAPLSVPYDGPAQWRRLLVKHIFHHKKLFGQMLLKRGRNTACSVCGNREKDLLMCCYCMQLLCGEGTTRHSELYDHARQCSAGVGVFWRVGGNGLLIVLFLSGCYVFHPGLYANEYGEVDLHQKYSETQLRLSDHHVKSWLSLWIRSRWCVESFVVRRLMTGDPLQARHGATQ